MTDQQRLAAVSEEILGIVENGPWVLIPDTELRNLVRAYIADACHSIAAAAGLDEAVEYAHDARPARMPTVLPDAVDDGREPKYYGVGWD